MTDTDLKLYELLGDKTLSFGCRVKFDTDEYTFLSFSSNTLSVLRLLNSDLGIEEIPEEFSYEIIGHEPTIADLHRWMYDRNKIYFTQDKTYLSIEDQETDEVKIFSYKSCNSLLDQSEETKKEIISFIELHS